jgi:atypical dual specificity phosphatase
MVAGREVPAEADVADFIATVDEFRVRAKKSTPRRPLIGVHCTHGLNRTGYFVCRYLMARMGFEPQEAIDAFDEARGHRQRRPYLLNHLKTRAWEGV